jgi:hypothetical protein
MRSFLSRLTRPLTGKPDGEAEPKTQTPEPRFRPTLEPLESRETPAVITVTNTSGNQGVVGSLPWAVFQANYFSPGFDEIKFNIPGAGPHIINLSSTLYINSQMNINGNSQPGYNGSRPLIAVHGGATVPSLFLLQNDPAQGTTSSGSTIQGLSMAFYTANAITIFSGSQGNWIQDNWIGFYRDNAGNVTQNRSQFNFTAGVGIQSSFNTIRNNTINGVYNGIVMGEAIEGSWSGTVYKTNSIQINRIGVDPTGTSGTNYGNTSDGIFLGHGARENFLGPDNVLSNNSSAAIEMLSSSNIGNVVFRSKIGTDITGNVAIGNGELGVLVANGAAGNAIGGPFGGNVISGNGLGGVALGTSQYPNAQGNWVQYNLIGTNAAQTAKLGNQGTGLSVESGAANNVIQGNVIAGHTIHGITMRSTQGNFINGNWIGMNAAGFGTGFENLGFGVALLTGANFNFVVGNVFGINNLGTIFVDPNAFSNAIS